MHKALILAASVTLLAVATSVVAQNYPARSIRIIAPTSPGGTSDFLARLLAAKFSDSLGQPVVVENRPGASSLIGAEVVAKAHPDGYTLLVSPAALAINPSMYAKVPFDARRDLAPISLIVETGSGSACLRLEGLPGTSLTACIRKPFARAVWRT